MEVKTKWERMNRKNKELLIMRDRGRRKSRLIWQRNRKQPNKQP
jgi:hypothetical protein